MTSSPVARAPSRSPHSAHGSAASSRRHSQKAISPGTGTTAAGLAPSGSGAGPRPSQIAVPSSELRGKASEPKHRLRHNTAKVAPAPTDPAALPEQPRAHRAHRTGTKGQRAASQPHSSAVLGDAVAAPSVTPSSSAPSGDAEGDAGQPAGQGAVIPPAAAASRGLRQFKGSGGVAESREALDPASLCQGPLCFTPEGDAAGLISELSNLHHQRRDGGAGGAAGLQYGRVRFCRAVPDRPDGQARLDELSVRGLARPQHYVHSNCLASDTAGTSCTAPGCAREFLIPALRATGCRDLDQGCKPPESPWSSSPVHCRQDRDTWSPGVPAQTAARRGRALGEGTVTDTAVDGANSGPTPMSEIVMGGMRGHQDDVMVRRHHSVRAHMKLSTVRVCWRSRTLSLAPLQGCSSPSLTPGVAGCLGCLRHLQVQDLTGRITIVAARWMMHGATKRPVKTAWPPATHEHIHTATLMNSTCSHFLTGSQTVFAGAVWRNEGPAAFAAAAAAQEQPSRCRWSNISRRCYHQQSSPNVSKGQFDTHPHGPCSRLSAALRAQNVQDGAAGRWR